MYPGIQIRHLNKVIYPVAAGMKNDAEFYKNKICPKMCTKCGIEHFFKKLFELIQIVYFLSFKKKCFF